MEKNVAAMQAALKKYGLASRPHEKTHKTAAIAKYQLSTGSIGICCAKLTEAEAMVASGVDKILMTTSNPSKGKIRRAMLLKKAHRDFIQAVDEEQNARDLSEAAREAGDRALGIALVGSAACQSRGPDEPQSRILKLQGTHDFGLADATPSNRLWMTAKEADAYALLGRDEECRRALDRAAALLGQVEAEGEERRPRYMALSANWLAGEQGASLAKLGRTEEARGLLLSALASLGPGGERDRSWLTLALATTYQKDREPEEAAWMARVAFTRASKINLQPVLALVRELVEDLKTMGDCAAVRELDQEIRGA